MYAAHLTSNVVRETYLAVALGERLSVRVDPYLGLHPDLFAIEGRGGYIDSNPGASLFGALPYALGRPFIDLLFRIKPALGAPKPPVQYDDPRPNRTRFMNAMRARGLDVRLGLAAFIIQLGLMAPLGALAAVAVFFHLRRRLPDERQALWYAALYAFGTPLFMRSAYLNQNLLLAHAVLFAWVILADGAAPAGSRSKRWLAAGALLGVGLLCDYSAAPLALVFGGWALWEGWTAAGARGGLGRWGAYALGAAVPIALLLGYQWVAFGSPWFPAQHYMPATELSGRGWNGLTPPSVDLLWRNLFDLRYGLFAFSPMLLAAFAAPWLRKSADFPTRREMIVALLAVAALWVFSSAVQFASLQWNTGVRYLVPAVPLLFFLLVPVLQAIPRRAALTLVGVSVLISWAVAMMREDVATSLRLLLSEGPTLPMLIVLRKTAAAYAPAFLSGGGQPLGILAVGLLGGIVWLIWRVGAPRLRVPGSPSRSSSPTRPAGAP